jgi:hypothetical protein
MPHRIENEEEIMKKEPTPTQQDHEMMLVCVERTPMGSRQPVHTVKVWREVFSPALERARLAEERRIAKEKQDKLDAIAKAKRDKENARLDKNAKAKVRRHLNKTFDNRVAVRADAMMKNHNLKELRGFATGYESIDTKAFTTKKHYANALATHLITDEDEITYQSTNRNNADSFVASLKGDAQ